MSEEIYNGNIILALPVSLGGFQFFCPNCRVRYYLDKFGHLEHGTIKNSFIRGPGKYKFPCTTPECSEEIVLEAIEVHC